MYQNRYDLEMKEEINFGKKHLFWLLGFILLVSGIGWIASRTEKVVDTAFVRYEEFQEIYNTCEKINTDLGIMKDLPSDDKMFEQFSKTQRVATLKSQLNRWVEDYNSKSKMWNRSIWKSNTLPYQLTVNQFSNY